MNEMSVTDTSNDDFFLDKESPVRLILQHPDTKHLLMARYDTCPLDHRFFLIDQPTDHELYNAKTRRVFYVDSYWSFVSIPHFRILPGETSPSEALCRTAERQLGIQIHRHEIVMVTQNPAFDKPIVERLYVYSRDWSGQLHRDVDPETLFAEKSDGYYYMNKQGVFEWVHPDYVSFYAHHPEVVEALNRAHEKVNLRRGLPKQ